MLEVQHLIISLAEPSHVQAQIISKALGEMGISKVETHPNGESLLSRARESRPDLVISAYYLPDMTGQQLLQQMRESADLSGMPFILVSSETNPERLEPIRQAGSLGILPKPFTSGQLDEVLANALDFINTESLAMEVDTDLANVQVLIVDDSQTSRRHVRAVLERLGFEHFTEAASGADALPLLESESFQLIIVDYHMPGMDGCELARHIRQSSTMGRTPILMITSETDHDRLAEVEAAGVSACCDKPFSTNKLRDTIRELLQEY
ncbi:response regulator [Chromobacterium haemolyticum]|uniref:Response regulator n=1 Tax=Chromobacterium fluminis TaxID=3044269 RepID=A0ABX0LAP9_9NEIS|nr:response regulator [Chromobacterium haemolyticum]NHR06627.1 response regulator [Chromobacterium haemolyticum]OQS40640.1 two-component system response regulator [Chromobacterium haemolyticum]